LYIPKRSLESFHVKPVEVQLIASASLLASLAAGPRCWVSLLGLAAGSCCLLLELRVVFIWLVDALLLQPLSLLSTMALSIASIMQYDVSFSYSA
jgi:hypothetical protein